MAGRQHGHCIHDLPANECYGCFQVAKQAARKFRLAKKRFDECMQLLRSVYPDANLYFNENSPSLFSGDTHGSVSSGMHCTDVHRLDVDTGAIWLHCDVGGF